MAIVLNSATSLEEAFNNWQEETISLLQQAINEVLLEVATTLEVVLMHNPINPFALPYIYNGATTKPTIVTTKTLKDGLGKGLMKVSSDNKQDSISDLRIIFNNIEYICVTRNNIEILVPNDQLRTTDVITQFLIDASKNYITSDLDLLIIAGKATSNYSTVEDQNRGFILQYELECINMINKLFADKLSALHNNQAIFLTDLVQHGPFNRFPLTQQSHIHFPISVISPHVPIYQLGTEDTRLSSLQDLRRYLQDLAENEYVVDIHQNWRLYEL